MPKYSLRYVIGPPIALNLVQGIGLGCIRYATGGTIKESLLVFGLVFGLFGFLLSLKLTEQLFIIIDPEVRKMVYELRSPSPNKDEFDMQVIIDSVDGYQADNFRGLTMKEWKKAADSISRTKKWTFASVGQTLHPKLTPMMLAAEYIQPAGAGKYELTNTGLAFWNNLSQRPYPWRDAPYTIQNLPTNEIYTQNI